MSQLGNQNFLIDESFTKMTRVSVWIFGGFVLLSVALPFLPDTGNPSNPLGVYLTSIFAALFFGALGWLGFRTVRQLSFSGIALDDEGLWPAHMSKNVELIRWERVHTIRERPYLQRLDLLDSSRAPLLRLEYQLSGFEILRALVMEKTRRPQESGGDPTALKKSALYHGFHVCSLVGFSLLGWYVGMTNPLLGYVGMTLLVGFILHDYLTTVCGLVISNDCLDVMYPLRGHRVRREDIADIRMGDEFIQGARHPEVGIFVRGAKKPIRIGGLSVGSLELNRILTTWKENKRR